MSRNLENPRAPPGLKGLRVAKSVGIDFRLAVVAGLSFVFDDGMIPCAIFVNFQFRDLEKDVPFSEAAFARGIGM